MMAPPVRPPPRARLEPAAAPSPPPARAPIVVGAEQSCAAAAVGRAAAPARVRAATASADSALSENGGLQHESFSLEDLRRAARRRRGPGIPGFGRDGGPGSGWTCDRPRRSAGACPCSCCARLRGRSPRRRGRPGPRRPSPPWARPPPIRAPPASPPTVAAARQPAASAKAIVGAAVRVMAGAAMAATLARMIIFRMVFSSKRRPLPVRTAVWWKARPRRLNGS